LTEPGPAQILGKADERVPLDECQAMALLGAGYVTSNETDGEEPSGRWQRRSPGGGARRWVKILLIVLGVPLLLGAGVALFAGRPIALAVVHRLTARKFPQVKWITGPELERWRSDSTRPQPTILDARTREEFLVSHLGGAVRIDPYRPILRPLRGFPKDTTIVVYSSVGYRGARLADFLARQGYSNVVGLDGGIFQWANEGRPIVRDDRPTEQVHPYDGRWGWLLESRHRAEAPPLPKRSAAP
jgi:rhodanese-related sulfurtransferase